MVFIQGIYLKLILYRCLMFLFLSPFYIVKADIDCILASENVSLQEWVSVYTEVSAVSLTLLTPCYAFVHPSLIGASPMMLVLGCHPQLFLYLIIWDRISYWAWSSLFLLDWLASKPSGSVCSSPSPSAGVVGIYHLTSFLSEFLGLWIHILLFAQQVPYWLSHSPRPVVLCFLITKQCNTLWKDGFSF